MLHPRQTSQIPPVTAADPPFEQRVTAPPLSQWAAVGSVIAVIFFAATATLSYRNQLAFAATEEQAGLSRMLMASVSELVSTLQECETAQRGFLVAEEESFLKPYQASLALLPKKMRDMQNLAISTDQRSAIAALEQTAKARLQNLEGTVAIYHAQGEEAAKAEIISGRGSALMAVLKRQANEFLSHEQQIVKEARERSANALRFMHLCDLLGAATGLGLAAAAFIRLRREFIVRHATAAHLEQQKELLDVTLHSIGDGVLTVDRRGNVRSLNATSERLTGWKAAEAIGKPLPDIFRTVHEQTRDEIENAAQTALRTGNNIRQPVQSLLITRDRTERRIEGSAAPIRSSDGQLLGSVLTFRDVTERRRAEDALRLSEERLRRALRASHTIAWEIDIASDIVIRSENASEVIGAARFGTIDEHLELVYEEDRPLVKAALNRTLHEGSDYVVEFRAKLPNGDSRWFVDKGEVRRDERGRPTHVVGALVDVTDLKLAQEELREADRRKDESLAMLAHELRNPLAPISNALEAWPFVKDDPVELDRLRDTMARQIKQMTRLIDDLLDVSRITRGKLVLQKQRTDLQSVIQSAIDSVRPSIDRRQHQLRVSIPNPPPVVDGDVARLVQIFGNLLHNAAKYTSDGGCIDLRVWSTAARSDDEKDQPSYAVVELQDNGTGISKEMLPRVFEMFAQSKQTLDRSDGGMGIGLTLVKTLVELHAGTVEASSDGLNRGATFTVKLPLAAEPLPDPTPTPISAPLPEPEIDQSTSFRVLVVDDMKPSARTLGLMLKGIGQEVEIAYDGAAAIEILESFEADVVLLDIAMPGMNGYETAQVIRDRIDPMRGRRTCLVALTGYGQAGDRERAFEAGFDQHLVKPTSLKDIQKVLAELHPSSARKPVQEIST